MIISWKKVQFSDEATFHVSGAVNHRNVRIWGSENPHAYVEHQRDSPKVSVFCAISSQKVYSPFFFAVETVTGMTYLDMLQLWLMPQLQNITDVHIPARWKSHPLPLWGSSVPEHSVTRMLDRACVWKWPTTDAMAPDVHWHFALFFLWECVKYRVFVTTFPRDLADLKARIIAAVKNIDAPTLTRVCVWQELEYRIDVCRVTSGAHIEHL